MAESAGAMGCASPEPEGIEHVARILSDATRGLGADHILIVAGGTSNGPVEAAARLARDRATVVDIGKTRLDLPWNAYYDKELDVRFSRSYGPGRYDDRYELEGIDYPAGYVRWTERRNLACFVDLLARGQLDVESLVSGTFEVEQRRRGVRPPELGRPPRGRLPVRISRRRHLGTSGTRRRRGPRAGNEACHGFGHRRGTDSLDPSARTAERHGSGRIHRGRELRVVDAPSSPHR